jgi:hypothetical protein
MKLRATTLCLVLGACAALPATATASKAKVYKMVRPDMRISLSVKNGKVVRGHVRAIERCGQGRNETKGFLNFQLFPVEAIPLRGDRSFHYNASFDDARGSAQIILDGQVNRRTIRGVFAFRNHEDVSCGSGRPGKRRVLYTARR